MQAVASSSSCAHCRCRSNTGSTGRLSAKHKACGMSWRSKVHATEVSLHSSDSLCRQQPRSSSLPRRSQRGAVLVRAETSNGDSPSEVEDIKYNKEFGYSRKDILLLGGGLFGLGYALYYGLQAFDMEPGFAGNVVQLTIFVGICVGYISTYIIRVANKDMTYVKQLDAYEEAVMRKRLEEMPDAEMERLMGEVDVERDERQRRRKAYLESLEKQK